MNGQPQTLDTSMNSEMQDRQNRRRLSLDDLEGEVLSGNYQIIRRIGKGGMGVVYLATQTKLGREVCVKVLNPDLIENEDAVGRFQREARGLSILHHPNIVTIFDYGCDGNLYYIVMEYAKGVTLNKLIKHNGPMTLDTFLPIAVQTLKGIGEAHKLGLIHRDIKPANIIICELDGEKNFVKILDFGLAKLAKGDDDVTKEHQLVGSASYMAPEQILTGISDTRTDVYALGVMFYLMLSGRKPFVGPNDNVVLYKHVNEQASPLRTMIDESQGIPEALCEVIDQCLNKSPDKRPANALYMLNAISCALDAPQLCASFSSMSVSNVDLQKLSEDGETHIMPSKADVNGIMTMSGVVSAINEGSLPGLQSSNVPTPTVPLMEAAPQRSMAGNAIPADPGMDISSVSGPSGISAPSSPGAQSYSPIREIIPKSSIDRKLVAAIVIVIVVLVSTITTAVIVNITAPAPQAPPQTQVNDNKLAGLISAVEESIAAKKWQEAETFLKSAMARPEAQTEQAVRNLIRYQNKIDCGKNCEKADETRTEKKFEEAKKQYGAILEKCPDYPQAREGLDIIERYYAEQSRISLNYDGDVNDIELYIDEQYTDITPEGIVVEPGLHTLKVTRDGYKDWIEKIELKKADSLSVKVRLEKKPEAKRPSRKTKHSHSSNDDDGDLLLAPSGRKNRSGSDNGLLGF